MRGTLCIALLSYPLARAAFVPGTGRHATFPGTHSSRTRSRGASDDFFDLPEVSERDDAERPAFPDAFARDEDSMLTEREDRLYIDQAQKVESCILVGVEVTNKIFRSRTSSADEEAHFTLEESMSEMEELIKTAGMELVGVVTQRLEKPNPKTYVGSGKVIEAYDLAMERECCTIVFDAELSPGQQKALENSLNKKALDNDFMGSEGDVKVIDRTALILDIFAQHAKSREGKLQVELALYEYRKPRLTRMWTHLGRQSGAGGVGLRGPGESQLEIDKRLLSERILTLKGKIDDVQKQRDLHRRGRQNVGIPVLSLVGYTNAGKSTLLNFLTRAGVMAEDILFATLDPTTRKVALPGYKTHPQVFLTDTVGFIQKLPKQLVTAFRATLEEVKEADLLIHVMDVTDPTWKKQEAAVEQVLADIGAGNKPIIRVLNKIDLLPDDEAYALQCQAALQDNAVAVSSITGNGLEDLVSEIEDALSLLLIPIEVQIPFQNGEELNNIHELGSVETIDYQATGTYVKGRVPRFLAMKLKPFWVNVDKHTSKEEEEMIRLKDIGRGRHSAQ